MKTKFLLIQVSLNLKLGFNLEFKCLIQDGNNYIWETIPNRKLKCDFRRNFVFIKFNTFGMDLRTFQKYEISHEFV
jgi:trehalose 6-phosphate synthase/phosphatase